MLGPKSTLSRHSYASGIFVAASHSMISTPEHGPAASLVHTAGWACPVFADARTNERTLTPLLRLWDLRHHVAYHDQHASHTLAGARTRRPAGSHHWPGLHPLRPLEHGPRTSNAPAPLPRLRDLASPLRSWSRWDYHPPAHAMGRSPVTSPPHEEVPSPASESDSEVARLKISFQWPGQIRGQLHSFTPTRMPRQGQVPSLQAAQ